MMHTLYFLNTGKILGSCTCQPDILTVHVANLPSGQGLIENGGQVDADEYYINLSNTTITPRPIMAATANKLTITADGVDTCTISTLPSPCSVTVDDTTYEVTDGSFEFSTLLTGEYVVKLESFPYKPKEFLVTAV
jgi:hypothetical protein